MSWRLPLADLAPEIREDLGADPGYRTGVARSLDAGYRLLAAGYIPWRTGSPDEDGPPEDAVPPCLADEILFLRRFFSRKWIAWTVYRMLRRREASFPDLHRALAAGRGVQRAPALRAPSESAGASVDPAAWAGRITVLLPTLDRYDYLDKTLLGVARQTIRPLEIVCVDQSAADGRRPQWPARVGDVPLVVIRRDRPGQCTSRNAGIRAARGEYILFLDDDIELPEDLIERHAECLERTGADASCGVAEELGAGPLPAEFTWPRVADVFPTNNTLLRKRCLERSGLFDEAYDRGDRADHDIGTRLYLSGAVLYLNPAARILHYHAPRGGLRTHGARVVTRGASRRSLTDRSLPSPTQIYLWRRHLPEEHVREAVAISRLSVLGSDAPSRAMRVARAALGAARAGATARALRASERAAVRLLREHPTIPPLREADAPPVAPTEGAR